MAGGRSRARGQRFGFGARRVDDPDGVVHGALTLAYSPGLAQGRSAIDN